jgi:hypothetical protein
MDKFLNFTNRAEPWTLLTVSNPNVMKACDKVIILDAGMAGFVRLKEIHSVHQ